MEFSVAQLPRNAEAGGQGPTDQAGHRSGHNGGQHPDPHEHGHRTQPHQLDGGHGEAHHQCRHTGKGDHAADQDPPAGRFEVRAEVIGESSHRGDPHRPSGRAQRRNHGDPDADHQGGHHGVRLEHERTGGQGNAKAPE